MKLNLFIGFVALASVLCTACGNTKHENVNETATTVDSAKVQGPSDKDVEFASNALSGGMMEVVLGEYASKNATSQAVKDFGAKMVADHTKGNNELKTWAERKSIAMPTTMSEKHDKMVQDLRQTKGKDFDKAYVDMMVEDHNEDVSKFEAQANNGNDADLKALAASTVPILKEHQALIKNVRNNMK